MGNQTEALRRGTAMEALSTALRGLDHIPWVVVLKVDVMKSREYKKEPQSSLRG